MYSRVYNLYEYGTITSTSTSYTFLVHNKSYWCTFSIKLINNKVYLLWVVSLFGIQMFEATCQTHDNNRERRKILSEDAQHVTAEGSKPFPDTTLLHLYVLLLIIRSITW